MRTPRTQPRVDSCKAFPGQLQAPPRGRPRSGDRFPVACGRPWRGGRFLACGRSRNDGRSLRILRQIDPAGPSSVLFPLVFVFGRRTPLIAESCSVECVHSPLCPVAGPSSRWSKPFPRPDGVRCGEELGCSAISSLALKPRKQCLLRLYFATSNTLSVALAKLVRPTCTLPRSQKPALSVQGNEPSTPLWYR